MSIGRLLTIFIICFLVASCASRHIKMYEGPEMSDSNTVSILFRSRLGPTVESIDGVDAPMSAIQIGRLIMKPGKHSYGVVVNYDPSFTRVAGAISLKWARGTVEIDGVKGHAYAFHWKPVEDNKVMFWYEDLGTEFPKECFDIRRWWSEPEIFERLGCR